jgi:hypothetical protein
VAYLPSVSYSHILGIQDEKRLFLPFFRDLKPAAFHISDRIPYRSPHFLRQFGCNLLF